MSLYYQSSSTMAWLGISYLLPLLGLGVVRISGYSTTEEPTTDWRYQDTKRSPSTTRSREEPTTDWRYQDTTRSPSTTRSTDGLYPTITGVSPSQYCGTYSQSYGSLTSKNYPSNYPNYVRCEYIISPGRSVYFKVVDADFETCCDHLKIFDQDGREWNWNANGYLYSPHITVMFHTDGSGTRRGFKLDWDPYYVPTESPYRLDYTTEEPTTDWRYQDTTRSTEEPTTDWRYQDTTRSPSTTRSRDGLYPTITGVSPSQYCGTYSQSYGSLTSKNYPSNYPNDVRCEYIISPGRSVYFKVVDADFETCCDHLRIFDQDGSEWNWNAKGYLYSSHITVMFHTDGSTTRRGFKLDWDPYSVPTENPYRLDYTTDRSRYTTIKWYSETTVPSSYSGTTDKSQKDCGTFTYDSGSLSSPNYPNTYPNNVNCRYTINANRAVYLRVVDYHLEDCCDHLQIYYDGNEFNSSSTSYAYGQNFTMFFKTDGSVTNRGFRIEWNPYSAPKISTEKFNTYTTDVRTSSQWYQRSTADWRVSTQRWYKETSQPSGHSGTTNSSYKDCGSFTKYEGNLSSPNYPNSYPNNVNCRYTINADRDVYLRVVDYHLEDCCDHLQIYYDGNEFNSSSTSYAYGQNFIIFFKTDGSVTNRGFRIEWNPYSAPTFSPGRFETYTNDHRTSTWYQETTSEPIRYCDQTSYSASGVIESPNYPFSYYNNLNCHYDLLTSTISILRVDAIDLERGYDSLQISYLSPHGYREYVNLTGSDRGHDMVGRDFRIDFKTDGSNTDRGFQLSWRLAGDYTTSSWQTTDWGSRRTLPWWRYTTDSVDKISINCNSHDFTVSVPRDVIRQVFPGVSEYNLALNNPNCRGQVYHDVLMFRSNILGCGMTREETRYDIVYQNRIRPVNSGRYTTDSYRWYTTEAPIVRFDSADIKVECHLDNYATAIGHFKPTNNHELIAVGRGNISVYMDFYRDYNYNYKITSYPISLGLNEDVYVDLRLDSDDNGLHMAVQRCIATPSYNRYTSEYHTLIRSGCPADQTVAFEHSSGQHIHFRFRGFEFLREKSNVFIFCDVNICNSTDYSSRCHRNCIRRRRDAESEPKSDLNLFQGPLKFRDARSADQKGGNAIQEKATQSMSISASVMAISAVAIVIAAVVLLIKRRKRNGQLLT